LRKSYLEKDQFGGQRRFYVSTFKTLSASIRERVERQQLGIWDVGAFDWCRFDEVELPPRVVRGRHGRIGR
jgi:hypothetical protein